MERVEELHARPSPVFQRVLDRAGESRGPLAVLGVSLADVRLAQ